MSITTRSRPAATNVIPFDTQSMYHVIVYSIVNAILHYSILYYTILHYATLYYTTLPYIIQ